MVRSGFRERLCAALAFGASACSLLAPGDAHFIGGGGATTPEVVCEPLPPPSGPQIAVTAAQGGQLRTIVAGAAAGTAIVLGPGTYALTEALSIAAPGVALRSSDGDATKVVLDGQGMVASAVVIKASNVTIADLTLKRATGTALRITPTGSTLTGIVIHGVRIIDGGTSFLGAEVGPSNSYVDDATVSCSTFQLTDTGVCCPTTCAVVGLDVTAGRGWKVRGNRFLDLHCPTLTDLAPFGALFEGGARDTLVENNTFLDCGRGLGLGQDSPVVRTYPDQPYGGIALQHIDGLVRNNVVWANVAAFDTGIEINHAAQPRFVHNTVIHGPNAANAFRSIDWRFADTRVVVENNLAISLGAREGAYATADHNLEQTPLAYFVNPDAGDLHLAAGASNAIDKGIMLDDAGFDIDGQPHTLGAGPDIGADERDPGAAP